MSSCGIYAEIAIIGEPLGGVSVVSETWSLRCLGACMVVAFVYVSLLVAKIVPADRRFVVRSIVRNVCISL